MGTATTKTETGLTAGTLYTRYVWAYNGCGASTATTLSQSTSAYVPCPASITDTRDGKVYNTIAISTQCWMAQSLNIGTRINGTIEQTNHSAIEKYCYNNDEAQCTVYGGLYQWDNAMQWQTTADVQGICMSGWHLPTDAEYTTLITYLGGLATAGGPAKETGTTHWSSPNTGATNTSGFSALPSGMRNTNGSFYNITLYDYFWSSTYYSATEARYRGFYYNAVYVDNSYNSKTLGFAVRCIRD